jgi:hypothetical protein
MLKEKKKRIESSIIHLQLCRLRFTDCACAFGAGRSKPKCTNESTNAVDDDVVVDVVVVVVVATVVDDYSTIKEQKNQTNSTIQNQ